MLQSKLLSSLLKGFGFYFFIALCFTFSVFDFLLRFRLFRHLFADITLPLLLSSLAALVHASTKFHQLQIKVSGVNINLLSLSKCIQRLYALRIHVSIAAKFPCLTFAMALCILH